MLKSGRSNDGERVRALPVAAQETARRRVKLVISYDGTNYQGWQVQKVGRGVQEVVEAALRKLFPSVKRLHGSSRTDTGVHAMGMAAHFDAPTDETRLPDDKIRLALNAHLPEDVRVMDAQTVDAAFHARFDALGKEYRYHVWNHRAANPLLRNRVWHVPTRVDIARVRAACVHFVGRKDFGSFAGAKGHPVESTVRTVRLCRVRRSGPLLTFVLRGDGFLYKMCRAIVGTLIQAGVGKIDPAAMPAILEQTDRRTAGMTAPAHGLYLWKVFY